MKTRSSCELTPGSLPHLHANYHRDPGLRSHPQHFASTASMPTRPPPQSIKVLRLSPTPPPFVYQVADCVPHRARARRRYHSKAPILLGSTGTFIIPLTSHLTLH